MFKKTFQATHPSMINGISNEALCDLYQVTDLFVAAVVNPHGRRKQQLLVYLGDGR